jgi:hypothetical protein
MQQNKNLKNQSRLELRYVTLDLLSTRPTGPTDTENDVGTVRTVRTRTGTGTEYHVKAMRKKPPSRLFEQQHQQQQAKQATNNPQQQQQWNI